MFTGISKANGVYKRDYAFRMNVMEEIFEIRSCIEILANDIKVESTQLISVCSTEKAKNTKYSKTKLHWFSHFLRHSARKRDGLILQRSKHTWD